MSQLKRVGDLEIDQDLDFQRKEWVVERWSWILMLLIVFAGLLGLFGQGPLSSTTVGDDPLKVHYGRFERLSAPTQMNIQVSPTAASNGEVRLRVDQSVMTLYNIQRIIPEPASTELSSGYITYVFKTGLGDQPFQIVFDLEPSKLGMPKGAIGLENGPSVNISQFIYP